MTNYSLSIKPSDGKALDALDAKLFGRIDQKIQELGNNPRPPGCRKLQGFADLWRIRFGDYRVVYAINDADATVDVIRVAHRREVYES